MKLLVRALIASLAVALFVTSAAAAASSSSVHNFATRAKIRLVQRSISSGDDLHIVGILTSGKHDCVVNVVLKLFFKGHQVGSKRTNNNGRAFFKANPRRTGKWQILFAGLKTGRFPERYFCRPDRSKAVKVKVS